MSTFYQTNLAEFQTGQPFSSVRANQVLTNLDAVYGLDQRQEFSFDYRWYDAAEDTWYGWAAFAEATDRLVVAFASTTTATITFDATAKRQVHVYNASGAASYTIPLPSAYRANEVYQVKVAGALPIYAVLTSTACVDVWGIVGAAPGFVDGTVLQAADLNKIIRGASLMYQYFNQPASCGTKRRVMNYTYGEVPTSFEVWSQYRHAQFQTYIVTDELWIQETPETIQWQVYVGSAWVTIWSYTIDRGEIVNELFRATMPSGLTVGNWYKFRFSRTPQPGNSRHWADAYWFGQERWNTAILWKPLHRWDYGTIVYGDESGLIVPPGEPQLYNMTQNLEHLNTNRRRWINHVQPARTAVPYTYYNGGEASQVYETFFGKRVHRWLAYQNGDADASANPPKLEWSMNDKNVMQSMTLPVATTTAYLDLDTTPVSVGRVFYASNVAYAIQTPDKS